MAIDIQQLNKRQAQIAEEKKFSRTGDAYGIYESRYANQERFEVKFDSSDTAGNLYYHDPNGVWLKLPIGALQKTDQYFDKLKRGNYVGIKNLEVAVERIDKEAGMVILKSGRVTTGIIGGVVRALDAQVKKAYEERKAGVTPEPYDIYGSISYVDEARENAYVNILNQRIRGVIHVSEWTDSFVRQFPEGIENSDEPIHFDLIGTKKIGGKKYYRLSTRRFGSREWEELPEHIQQGSVVCVTCTDTSNTQYWYGIADGFSVEWRGRYTDKFSIQEGMQYLVTLKRVNSERHGIWMVPFKYLKNEMQGGESGVAITKEDISKLLAEKKQSQQDATDKRPSDQDTSPAVPEGLMQISSGASTLEE